MLKVLIYLFFTIYSSCSIAENNLEMIQLTKYINNMGYQEKTDFILEKLKLYINHKNKKLPKKISKNMMLESLYLEDKKFYRIFNFTINEEIKDELIKNKEEIKNNITPELYNEFCGNDFFHFFYDIEGSIINVYKVNNKKIFEIIIDRNICQKEQIKK